MCKYICYIWEYCKKDSDGDGLLDNSDITYKETVIAPKDNEPLKYNGIYNVWKKHIYEMQSDDVGTDYLDNGSQATVKKELQKLMKKHIKNVKARKKCKKIAEWTVNIIEKKIRKEIIKNKDNLDLFVKKNEKKIKLVTKTVKKFFNGETAGAYILNFAYDDQKNAYHSIPVTWQKSYGYNDFFDTVFGAGTNMLYKKIPFESGNINYILWMWKGDYWNLGTGAEMGLYQKAKECNTHYDAVDFLLNM